MTKTQLLKVIKQTSDGLEPLNKIQKFQVFVEVCDNMLEQHRITQDQHSRWTNIY